MKDYADSIMDSLNKLRENNKILMDYFNQMSSVIEEDNL